MLSGWGGQAVVGEEHLGESLEPLTRGATLTRGLGRSYGDSSLPADPRRLHRRHAHGEPHPRVRRGQRRHPRRGRAQPRRAQPHRHAARLLPAGHAGHEVHHARRRRGQRRARRQPPRRRLLRRARARAAPPPGGRPHRRVQPNGGVGAVLGHRRWHGPARPHPRGRVPARAHRRAVALCRVASRCPTSRRSSTDSTASPGAGR